MVHPAAQTLMTPGAILFLLSLVQVPWQAHRLKALPLRPNAATVGQLDSPRTASVLLQRPLITLDRWRVTPLGSRKCVPFQSWDRRAKSSPGCQSQWHWKPKKQV